MLDEEETALAVLNEALTNVTEGTLAQAFLLEWRGRVTYHIMLDADAALPDLDEAIALYERKGDSGGLADALDARADILFRAARIYEAISDTRAGAAVSKLPQPDRLFTARVTEGGCLFALDQLAEARQILELALADFADREQEGTSVFHAFSYLARIAGEVGDFGLAAGWITEAIALDSRGVFGQQVGQIQADLIGVEMLAGRPDSALQAYNNGRFLTQHASARAAILSTLLGAQDDDFEWALTASILLRNLPELAYLGSTVARTTGHRADLVPFMHSALAAADRIPNTRWADSIRESLRFWGSRLRQRRMAMGRLVHLLCSPRVRRSRGRRQAAAHGRLPAWPGSRRRCSRRPAPGRAGRWRWPDAPGPGVQAKVARFSVITGSSAACASAGWPKASRQLAPRPRRPARPGRGAAASAGADRPPPAGRPGRRRAGRGRTRTGPSGRRPDRPAGRRRAAAGAGRARIAGRRWRSAS